MARECRKKAEYVQNNQTSGWSGTGDETKGKPGKGKSEKDMGRGKPGKGKDKDMRKGKKQKTRQRNNNVTRWRGMKTNTKQNLVKSTQCRVTRV